MINNQEKIKRTREGVGFLIHKNIIRSCCLKTLKKIKRRGKKKKEKKLYKSAKKIKTSPIQTRTKRTLTRQEIQQGKESTLIRVVQYYQPTESILLEGIVYVDTIAQTSTEKQRIFGSYFGQSTIQCSIEDLKVKKQWVCFYNVLYDF